MKSLVIGDVHEKIRWIEDVIKRESPDEVIFLGDYFDSFITTPQTVKDTCEWLVYSLKQKNRIHLLGNHEQYYRWPLVKKFVCSGNTQDKQQLISSILKFEHWDKIKLFHFSQGYLFSHAGVSERLFAHPVQGLTLDIIREECEKAITTAQSGGARPALQAGWSRGGSERDGGITWLDFSCEAMPVVGFHQIVGHTPVNSPTSGDIVKYVPNKKNPTGTIRTVDFKGRFYTIIKDGVISYQSTGCEGYNEREHKLVGEPFIDTRKIIEHQTRKIVCSVCESEKVGGYIGYENGDKTYFCNEHLPL